MKEARFFRYGASEWEESKPNPGVMLSPIARDRPCSRFTSYIVTIPSGGGVKPHVHDRDVTDISFIVAGQGLALINGSWLECQQGDYFMVPPGVEHGVRNVGEDPMMIFALLVTG